MIDPLPRGLRQGDQRLRVIIKMERTVAGARRPECQSPYPPTLPLHPAHAATPPKTVHQGLFQRLVEKGAVCLLWELQLRREYEPSGWPGQWRLVEPGAGSLLLLLEHSKYPVLFILDTCFDSLSRVVINSDCRIRKMFTLPHFDSE